MYGVRAEGGHAEHRSERGVYASRKSDYDLLESTPLPDLGPQELDEPSLYQTGINL